MISDADDYFTKGCGRCDRFDTPACSALQWAEGLAALRALCLSEGLTETVKWGHPCYMHEGRNTALIGAFRGDFRLTLMNCADLDDPEGLLTRAGPNSRIANVIRFADSAQVAGRLPALRALLAQAKAQAATGKPPKRSAPDVAWPDELAEALSDDPDLSAAFDALTPGRQRSYVILLSSAKTSATRHARIARSRDRILAGKGANER